MASAEHTVRTHCPYCSLNCGLQLVVSGGEVTGSRPWMGSPLNDGGLCLKGTTAWTQVHHPDRLLRPLVRRGSELEETSWEEALAVAADGFARIRADHGAAANAVLGGGSLTNEKGYLLGKLARIGFGTPHVDLNGRLCMSTAAAAATRAFGLDRAMTPIEEVANAQVLVVVGANLATSYPLVLPHLRRFRDRGGRLVVVDPRTNRFTEQAAVHLPLRPGTDAALANGLLHLLVTGGLVDEGFIEERTTGFAEAAAAAAAWGPDRVAAVCDVPPSDLVEAARLIGSSERVLFWLARGPEQQTSGVENALAYINVALAVGAVGRPGCGIVSLTGQRNGHGGREHGMRADQLPGYRRIDDPDHRRDVAAAWGIPEETLPGRGLTYVEILRAAAAREVRGLLTISTNPAVSSPDGSFTERALSALDHLVVIDPFLTETARHATVVLPGSTFAEEEGTVTTVDGRLVRIDRAISPCAGLDDIAVLTELGARLGNPGSFPSTDGRGLFEELRRVTAGAPADYSGITWDRIRETGEEFWPLPEPGGAGPRLLFEKRFAHSDGRARFHPVDPRFPAAQPTPDLPMVMTTGRVLTHYLSGAQTRRTPALVERAPEPVAELHPETAARLGLVPTDRILVTSARAALRLRWQSKTGLRRDTVFIPFHWPGVNDLTAADLDPVSKIAGVKHTPVRVQRAPDLKEDQ